MVGVLDARGLLGLLRQVEGRRLLGVLDCGDCLEVVFSEAGHGPNLITFWMDGRHRGLVSLGFVLDAEQYGQEGRRFEEAA